MLLWSYTVMVKSAWRGLMFDSRHTAIWHTSVAFWEFLHEWTCPNKDEEQFPLPPHVRNVQAHVLDHASKKRTSVYVQREVLSTQETWLCYWDFAGLLTPVNRQGKGAMQCERGHASFRPMGTSVTPGRSGEADPSNTAQ